MGEFIAEIHNLLSVVVHNCFLLFFTFFYSCFVMRRLLIELLNNYSSKTFYYNGSNFSLYGVYDRCVTSV